MPDVFESITRSLHRQAVVTPPAPPLINPAVARLVYENVDRVALFRERASGAKMRVVDTSAEFLVDAIVEQLRARQCRSVIITDSVALPGVKLNEKLSSSGFDAMQWSDSSLDASYDVDVGVTDVYRAVAETGSIVIRESASHGRAVSLVPPIHFAIVCTSQIVPDLIDLMADFQREGTGSGTVIITGPSKTADIEMNLVVGVHGPGEVLVFLVDDSHDGVLAPG